MKLEPDEFAEASPSLASIELSLFSEVDGEVVPVYGQVGVLFWGRLPGDETGGVYCATPAGIEDTETRCSRADAVETIRLSWGVDWSGEWWPASGREGPF